MNRTQCRRRRPSGAGNRRPDDGVPHGRPVPGPPRWARSRRRCRRVDRDPRPDARRSVRPAPARAGRRRGCGTVQLSDDMPLRTLPWTEAPERVCMPSSVPSWCANVRHLRPSELRFDPRRRAELGDQLAEQRGVRARQPVALHGCGQLGSRIVGGAHLRIMTPRAPVRIRSASARRALRRPSPGSPSAPSRSSPGARPLPSWIWSRRPGARVDGVQDAELLAEVVTAHDSCRGRPGRSRSTSTSASSTRTTLRI